MFRLRKLVLVFLVVYVGALLFFMGYNVYKNHEIIADRDTYKETEKKHAVIRDADFEVPKTFSDIKGDEWYAPDVSKLVNMGIIDGYGDGSFKPSSKVSVGEFLKLILSASGKKVEENQGVWYEAYVKKAKELGIVDSSDNYNYEAPIKRVAMAKMTYILLNLPDESSEGLTLSDVSSVDLKWVETVFNECLMRGFVSKSGHVVFRPNQVATRGEACSVIVRILDYLKDPEEYRKSKINYQAANGQQNSVNSGNTQPETLPVAKEIPVLLYHHMLKKDENKCFKTNYSVVSVEEFESQMKFLYDKGFYTITPLELEKFLKKEINLPYKSVLITFDDGYKSNFLYAYPILKKYGFRATLFAVTGGIFNASQRFNPDLLTMSSWEEFNEGADVFDYGSHTHAMHNESKGVAYLVGKPVNDIKFDLSRSKELLNTAYLSYPYGQYNGKTISILQELGYKLAFTTKEQNVTLTSSPYELGRYYMNSGRDIAAVVRKTYPDFEKQN